MQEKYVWLGFNLSLAVYILAALVFLAYLRYPEVWEKRVGGDICSASCANGSEFASMWLSIQCPGLSKCISFEELLGSKIMKIITVGSILGYLACALALILLYDDRQVTGHWKWLVVLLIILFGFFGVWFYLHSRKKLRALSEETDSENKD